jgi:hypothetical protein
MVNERSDVVLRATSKHLWVARRGDYPVGMIEQGRRYTATDLDGEVIARCRTLQDAWEALASVLPPEPEPEPEAGRPQSRWWAGAACVLGTPVALLGALGAVVLQH